MSAFHRKGCPITTRSGCREGVGASLQRDRSIAGSCDNNPVINAYLCTSRAEDITCVDHLPDGSVSCRNAYYQRHHFASKDRRNVEIGAATEQRDARGNRTTLSKNLNAVVSSCSHEMGNLDSCGGNNLARILSATQRYTISGHSLHAIISVVFVFPAP